MRPKPQLSVALPRAVGVEGRAELGEFTLAARLPARLRRAACRGAAGGHGRARAWSRSRAPGRSRRASRALATGSRSDRSGAAAAEESGAVLMPAVSRYTTAEAAVVERVREGRSKAVDVRAYVPRIDAEPTARGVALSFTAEVTPNGTVRPEEVVAVVARIAGVDLVTRALRATGDRAALSLDGPEAPVAAHRASRALGSR